MKKFIQFFFQSSRNFQGMWPKTIARMVGLFFIRLYQMFLSPWLGFRCRHFPTCSEYTYEAIARHGLCFGFFLSLFRFFRCGPVGNWCIDPVPEELPDNIFFQTLQIFLMFFSKIFLVFLYLYKISSYIVYVFFLSFSKIFISLKKTLSKKKL